MQKCVLLSLRSRDKALGLQQNRIIRFQAAAHVGADALGGPHAEMQIVNNDGRICTEKCAYSPIVITNICMMPPGRVISVGPYGETVIFTLLRLFLLFCNGPF